MLRKNPISLLLYNYLFPSPRPQDPQSFQQHLAKNLVPEVRIETATFYGSLDTVEARYPGLNYCHGPHRKRLGRFPHHCRLFKAFDDLGLTETEIQSFCKWEGTLWARERFERDEGRKVEDTTGIDIGPWIDPRTVQRQQPHLAKSASVHFVHQEPARPDAVDSVMDDDMSEEESEDEEETTADVSTPRRSHITPAVIPSQSMILDPANDKDAPDSSDPNLANAGVRQNNQSRLWRATMLHAVNTAEQAQYIRNLPRDG